MKTFLKTLTCVLFLLTIPTIQAQVHLISTDSLLGDITTSVTEWYLPISTEESISRLIDGDKSTLTSQDYQFHPMNATGKHLTFTWRETYTQGEFLIFNRLGCCSYRILGTTIEYMVNDVTQQKDTISMTHSIADTSELTLTPTPSVPFNKIKLTFPHTENGAQNLREIEVRGALLTPTVTSESATVSVGNTTQLNIQHTSASAITWTSLDPSIATVDESGIVTGIDTGTVQITAILKLNTTLIDTSTVVVGPASTSIFNSAENQINSVTLYHLDGTYISTFSTTSHAWEKAIDTHALKPGVYFIRLSNGEVKKFFLQNERHHH